MTDLNINCKQFGGEAYTAPTFEYITEFIPAWDRRSDDPKKDYGIHCVDLKMVLKGPKGAIHFVLSTGWYLPQNKSANRNLADMFPMPCYLGYHSPVPQYEDQPSQNGCPYVAGGTCYYDGSILNAKRVYQILLKKGSDGVWAELEDYYHTIFDALTTS